MLEETQIPGLAKWNYYNGDGLLCFCIIIYHSEIMFGIEVTIKV